LLVAIVLVSIFTILLIINIFSRTASEKRMISRTELSKLSTYLDFFKGFSRAALLFSVHAGTKTVAGFGGEISKSGLPRNWICNFDVSPSVDEVRYFLSNQTLEYLNRYVPNMKIEDLPQINVSNFTCVDFDVNNAVFSGAYDEAFNVSALGSEINVSLQENMVSSKNEIYEEIEKVRFWYMYRKFKEWASSTRFRDYVASCEPILCQKYTCNYFDFACSDDADLEGCVNNAVQNALKELNSIFNDKYVKCKATLTCCNAVAMKCQQPPPCEKCCACEKEEAGELCGKKYVQTSSSKFSYTQSDNPYKISFSGTGCSYWQGNRLDVEADFSCTDEKYLLSVPGDRKLTFTVHATANIVVPNDCRRDEQCIEECCEYDENNTCIRWGEKCPDAACWCTQDCYPKC
jgi:hypothetical protein